MLLGVWLLREHFGFGATAAFALILVGSWPASRAGPRFEKRRMQRNVT